MYVTRVGAEPGWPAELVPSHKEPAAFDEPLLGIIGMWREGGGANPYFALAVGEITARLGQRHLAWCAYERASMSAERYGTDAATHEFLRGHCKKRQAMIEARLPAEEVRELRPRFTAELAFGQNYQRDYQDYESARIADGMNIDDAGFYRAFLDGRPAIASPIGPEDELTVHPPRLLHSGPPPNFYGYSLFGAGLCALAAAFVLRHFAP